MKNNKNEIRPKFAIYSRRIMNENGEQEGKEQSLVVRYPEGMLLPDIENLMNQFVKNQGIRPFSSGRMEGGTLDDIAKAMDDKFKAIYG